MLTALLGIGAVVFFLYVGGAFGCRENRGHRYGPVSDLCLNGDCNEERGSWKLCDGH